MRWGELGVKQRGVGQGRVGGVGGTGWGGVGRRPEAKEAGTQHEHHASKGVAFTRGLCACARVRLNTCQIQRMSD